MPFIIEKSQWIGSRCYRMYFTSNGFLVGKENAIASNYRWECELIIRNNYHNNRAYDDQNFYIIDTSTGNRDMVARLAGINNPE